MNVDSSENEEPSDLMQNPSWFCGSLALSLTLSDSQHDIDMIYSTQSKSVFRSIKEAGTDDIPARNTLWHG